MNYLGDYAENYATLNFKFQTLSQTGVPTTLSNSPVVKVYKANSTTTETATGVTLTVDFDTVTGLNNVKIDLANGAFYAISNDYQVIVTTGTVNSVSVVGLVIAEFSIENRFNAATALLPSALVGGRIDATVDATGMETGAIDALWQRQFTEAYNADGTVPTPTQAMMLILQRLTQFTITGTAFSVKKIDGTTEAVILAMNDSTTPTAMTRNA